MSPVFIGLVQQGRLHLDFRKQFDAYLRQFEGYEVEVEVRRRREKRSLRQNAGFHAMVTPWVLSEGYPIEDLKRDLLREVFGVLEVSVSPVDGKPREILAQPHTSDLSVREFCELIERTLEIAAGCGVLLQAPDEYRKAKEALAKAEARKAKKAATAA